MTDAITYDEHKEFLNRQVDGALAEYAGFVNARVFDEITVHYAHNAGLQARYALGFRYGKAMLLAMKETVR